MPKKYWNVVVNTNTLLGPVGKDHGTIWTTQALTKASAEMKVKRELTINPRKDPYRRVVAVLPATESARRDFQSSGMSVDEWTPGHGAIGDYNKQLMQARAIEKSEGIVENEDPFETQGTDGFDDDQPRDPSNGRWV